jgi:hypothetical protein
MGNLVGLMALLAIASADLEALPTASRSSLDAAVGAAVERYNAAEDELRKAPRIEASGPEGEPSLLRATYRHAGAGQQMLSADPGPPPVVVVRVRAAEMEKRVTNVNGGDLRAALLKAPWHQTPRGYVIDFRLRWDGTEWRQVGDPVVNPTLGVVGRPGADEVLERAAPSR